MGFLGNLLGTNSLNHSFNYTPSTASYTPNNAMNQSISNLNQNASSQFNMQRNMYNQAQDLMEGRGSIMEAWQNQLSERMANQTASQSMQMNKQLAQRGMGTGGLANLVNAGMQNRAGEQLSQGMVGLMGQGAQMGQGMMQSSIQLGGLGMQGLQGAGSLASQQDQRALQQAMFNVQQQNEQRQYTMTSRYNQAAGNRAARGEFAGNVMGAAGTAATAKAMMLCIPKGTEIDTSKGKVKIEQLKAGDKVLGFNGKEVTINQKHEYKENPDLNRFLEITFDDDSKVNLCDMHKIDGKRSKDYIVGNKINDKTIKNIKWYGGVKTSYDLLTDDKGYSISGIPVNSMIEELVYTAYKIKEAA